MIDAESLMVVAILVLAGVILMSEDVRSRQIRTKDEEENASDADIEL